MCNPPTKTKSIQVKKVAALDLVQAGKRNIKAVAGGGSGDAGGGEGICPAAHHSGGAL